MEEASIKTTCEGPRWACIPEFIKNLAFELDLKCDIDVDKGWIRENIRFKVSGAAAGVLAFKRVFEKAFKQYNAE